MLRTWLPAFTVSFALVGCTTATPQTTIKKTGASALSIGNELVQTDVPMKNVDNTMVSIGQVAGSKGTLVVFTCNHCPWAKAWEDRIVEIGNTYRERGVGVIAINPNDPSTFEEDSLFVMQERARETGMKFPYVVDETSNVTRAFGATKTPEVFLFNGDRKLIYHGAVDDNANEPQMVSKTYLKNALDALLSNQTIPVATTKAIGCGIKFPPSTEGKS